MSVYLASIALCRRSVFPYGPFCSVPFRAQLAPYAIGGKSAAAGRGIQMYRGLPVSTLRAIPVRGVEFNPRNPRSSLLVERYWLLDLHRVSL